MAARYGRRLATSHLRQDAFVKLVLKKRGDLDLESMSLADAPQSLFRQYQSEGDMARIDQSSLAPKNLTPLTHLSVLGRLLQHLAC